MLNDNQFNVLFLCTGNSARSVIAEALLMKLGQGKFNSYSAGSKPKGEVHPKTIETLKKNNFSTENYSSKSWDEFTRTNAPQIDIVITVCSNAANESCPIFPGKPISIHWDLDDPAREFDSEEEQDDEFEKIFNELERRIKNLTIIFIEKMDIKIAEENLKKMSDPK